MSESKVIPYSLKDAPALIERLFPAQKISAEAQKERKSIHGQTLTALGSYWKGRKPLVLVRACVLASLLPVTSQPERDLAVFERLMAIDDAAFRHRVKKAASWPDILKRPYLDRLADSVRYEELPDKAYAEVWADANGHLGTQAHSFAELVEQLGIMRFGHRPRLADTFAGGGSIPFEAARLGCDVSASDLNPMACLLTWGAVNVVGAPDAKARAIRSGAAAVVAAVEKEIAAGKYETDESGNRIKALLYCVEVTCPQTGWAVPLAPSWIVSNKKGVNARLVPDRGNRRFAIEIGSGFAATAGTFRDGNLVYELDGQTWSTPIRTLRGDHREPDGSTANRLRRWTISDVAPAADDIFRERLYCIQWIAEDKVGKAKPPTYFAAPTAADLAREARIQTLVEENLALWQRQGLVPATPIEPGDKTDEPIRTRGWTFWHHLYHPRHLLIGSLLRREMLAQPAEIQTALSIGFARSLNYMSRMTQWLTRQQTEKSPGDVVNHVFYNQALNTFYNYGQRGFLGIVDALRMGMENTAVPGRVTVRSQQARETTEDADIYVTDPPYADAVIYDEISEYFIAWFKGSPPVKEWIWDSRRALAIRGDGEAFRQGMVEAYSAMAQHMPDNGLQIVMFTHQSSEVWGDMAQIFWGAGLRVMAAWYIATETTSDLKKGGYVQGTVILVLRKRLSNEAGYKNEVVQEVKAEVANQIDTMVGLNQSLRGHGRIENLFEDADLQMAGYAAALRVLTGYAKIDGRDMTREALRPRQKGEKGLVSEIIDFAVQVANEHMVPEGMDARVWERLSGAERFYLKMLDIETTGAKKLDNYQNFAKAFRVADYSALMSSTKPNDAHLKSSAQLKRGEFGESEFGRSPTRALLFALCELQEDMDGDQVLSHLRDLVTTYDTRRDDVAVIATYIARKREEVDPGEAKAARILHGLIRNERIGS